MQHIEFKNLFRHIKKCNTAKLQKDFLPFKAHNQIIGWVRPSFMDTLQKHHVVMEENNICTLPAQYSIEMLGNQLIENNVVRSMNELFDVYPSPYAKPVGKIDRAVIPDLGLIGTGVHLNGLVKKRNQIYLWIAKRAKYKRLDPEKLDHIVAGGIPAGFTHNNTLEKEACEEASIPHALMINAEYKSLITYSMIRPEGLRRDVLYCYDLWLPEDFQPVPNDGEVESFQLKKLDDVYHQVCETDDFKFNVNLVLIDLFIRMGIIAKNSQYAHRIKTGLRGKLFP